MSPEIVPLHQLDVMCTFVRCGNASSATESRPHPPAAGGPDHWPERPRGPTDRVRARDQSWLGAAEPRLRYSVHPSLQGTSGLLGRVARQFQQAAARLKSAIDCVRVEVALDLR
jgi:hypothetical protein